MRFKDWWKYALLIIILVVLVRWIGFGNVLSEVRKLNPVLFIGAFAVYFATPLLRAWRFHGITGRCGSSVNLRRNLGVHFVTPILGRITPGKVGELGKVFLMGGEKKIMLFSWVLERLFDFALLAGLSIIIVVPTGFSLHAYFVFLLLLFAGILALWYSDPVLKLAERFASRLLSRDLSLGERWFSSYIKKVGVSSLLLVLLQTILVWAVSFFMLYLLALSANVEVNFFVLSSAIALSAIIGVLSTLPGGFGAREASLAFILTQVGVPLEIAGSYAVVLFAFILLTESLSALLGWLVYK